MDIKLMHGIKNIPITTIKEIEDSTGAYRKTIKAHVKKLAEQHYLIQAGKGRGARYTIK